MHSVVDLRSDTITCPSAGMRRAMADAEVGDDVFDEDPTVHRLQDRAAELLAADAALFMPSGTMSNLVAILSHTRAGQEILLDDAAHSLLYEVGSPAAVAHVLTRPFRSRNGIPDVDEIDALIQPESLHGAGTALVVIENTHNRAGGAIVPLDVHERVWTLAQDRGVRVHIDGARIFNAAVASGISAAQYAANSDSITFCLSKGLGCPAGSVLCGSADFIAKARRFRKMLGGGMRQSGVLAAAGLYALEHNVERLAEDHRNAQALARGIADANRVQLDTAEVPTNMVYFNTDAPAQGFVEQLEHMYGVRCAATALRRIRLVTHLDVDAEDVDRAISAICEVGRSQ